MHDTLNDIRNSAHTFDIFDEASELEAAQFVDEMSGEGDETPAEDANVPDARPLDSAVEILRVSKSPVFQEIFGALKALHAECLNKSKDEKQTADFRSLNHTKGLGVEQSIGVFITILEESEARLKSATPAERHAMGKDANTFISDLISPVAAPQTEAASPKRRVINVGPSSLEETPKSASVPSAGVQSNTKRAQEWLKKTDATRD
jgi:hypothetical protein